MNVPLRNMKTGQYYLSSGEHTLRLDFSNSYFNRVKVRVKAVLVNTDGSADGVDDYLTALQASDPAVAADPTQAKERYLYPTSNWAEGVEFSSDGGSKEIQMQLPQNDHKNMMYKVVVEYARHKGGGNFADGEGEWLQIAGLEIYQDGKPLDGQDVIWKYGGWEWPQTLWAEFNPSSFKVPYGPDIGGTEDGTWIYTYPLTAQNSTTWNNWKSWYDKAVTAKVVDPNETGPNGITARKNIAESKNVYCTFFIYDNIKNNVWYYMTQLSLGGTSQGPDLFATTTSSTVSGTPANKGIKDGYFFGWDSHGNSIVGIEGDIKVNGNITKTVSHQHGGTTAGQPWQREYI